MFRLFGSSVKVVLSGIVFVCTEILFAHLMTTSKVCVTEVPDLGSVATTLTV